MWFHTQRFGSITELGTGRRVSPSELARQVATRAAALRARGIGRGDRVLLRQAGSCGFFADLFGVWEAGACAICVSPHSTPAEIERISSFMHPRLVLSGGDAEADAAALPHPHSDGDASSPAGGTLDDDALILLTSGTTGIPKGVVHSMRGLLARLALNRAVIGDEVLRRTLCLLPVHFGHGLIGNCLTPLVAGHDLLLASDLGPALFSDLDRVVDEHAVTFMSSVPATWRMVSRFSRRSPKRPLARVHVGSAALSASLWQSIIDWSGTDEVVNAYGLTETANWVAGASARTHGVSDGLVGRLWGGAAAVLRPDGQLATVGEGEVVLQVPSAMRGYFQRPDLDAETWVNGWFRTRDLGEIAADGTIRLLARLGEDINRGGMKVFPHDIESVLDRHPQVAESCAFALPDEILGQTVAVAVALAPDRGGDLAEIKAWLTTQLSKDKRPDRWFVVDAIPRTDRGKVNRKIVAETCLAPAAASAPVSAIGAV
jgi:acyl-CoA synthetase (AMP-forming)/AMP-acid ligase II